MISRTSLSFSLLTQVKPLEVASKEHHDNDVVIIINVHYIIGIILKSVQHAYAKTANEHDGLLLRVIQPGDFLSAISLVDRRYKSAWLTGVINQIYLCRPCKQSMRHTSGQNKVANY